MMMSEKILLSARNWWFLDFGGELGSVFLSDFFVHWGTKSHPKHPTDIGVYCRLCQVDS